LSTAIATLAGVCEVGMVACVAGVMCGLVMLLSVESILDLVDNAGHVV
jgi:hypothetical protein